MTFEFKQKKSFGKVESGAEVIYQSRMDLMNRQETAIHGFVDALQNTMQVWESKEQMQILAQTQDEMLELTTNLKDGMAKGVITLKMANDSVEEYFKKRVEMAKKGFAQNPKMIAHLEGYSKLMTTNARIELGEANAVNYETQLKFRISDTNNRIEMEGINFNVLDNQINGKMGELAAIKKEEKEKKMSLPGKEILESDIMKLQENRINIAASIIDMQNQIRISMKGTKLAIDGTPTAIAIFDPQVQRLMEEQMRGNSANIAYQGYLKSMEVEGTNKFEMKNKNLTVDDVIAMAKDNPFIHHAISSATSGEIDPDKALTLFTNMQLQGNNLINGSTARQEYIEQTVKLEGNNILNKHINSLGKFQGDLKKKDISAVVAGKDTIKELTKTFNTAVFDQHGNRKPQYANEASYRKFRAEYNMMIAQVLNGSKATEGMAFKGSFIEAIRFGLDDTTGAEFLRRYYEQIDKGKDIIDAINNTSYYLNKVGSGSWAQQLPAPLGGYY
ncbi:MAG: hypothetical protein LBC06_01170 [Rickettsiales bacterium]|jgi:hypothetical protein|nr:hypothetical protein [Rickettsiales bacterium]